MESVTYIFTMLALAIGTIGMFAGLLFVGAWTVHKALDYLKVWHVYMLAVSIHLHGKDYADRQFWQAVSERAGKSATSARIISDYALRHAPAKENDP